MNALTELHRIEREALRLAETVRQTLADIGATPASRSTIIQLEELRRRRKLFGSPVGDPSCEIMIDLYRAHLARRWVSVSSACIAGGAAPTTGLRHLSRLVEIGYVQRHNDPADARRVFVSLTTKAIERMDQYFDPGSSQDASLQ